MRRFVLLAAVAALVSSSGNLRAAPVPADKPQPTIEGKYTLVSVYMPNDRVAPGGGFPGGAAGPAGGWGAATTRVTPAVAMMLGPATIAKNEITLEGRPNVSALSSLTAGVVLPMSMHYTIDTTKTPMTIDVETTTTRGKKVKSLGLVEVNNDRLIIAVAKEGDERPKTTDEAEGVTVYYFQKAPPPPKVEFRIVAMTVGKEADAEKELNKLAALGFELVSTTNPAASDAKAAPTTVHFILKRTTK